MTIDAGGDDDDGDDDAGDVMMLVVGVVMAWYGCNDFGVVLVLI